MKYKKSYLSVNNESYIYTIRPKPQENIVKVTIYKNLCKKIYVAFYFSFIETWGFDVYRPKMIELLIRFYKEKCLESSKNIFTVGDCPELFYMLMEYFFADSSIKERELFEKNCKVFVK